MKNPRYLASLIALIALMGCSPCAELESPTVYIGLQANTEDEVELAKGFLYEAYKGSNGGNKFIIDLLKGDTTVRLLSQSSMNRETILEVINTVENTQSTDLAVTSFFHRVKDLSDYGDEEIHAYLVSAGTSDKTTLSDISRTLTELSGSDEYTDQELYLYMLGLSDDNRLNVSDSLHPIRENVEAVGRSSSEWLPLSTKYNAYYCSSES